MSYIEKYVVGATREPQNSVMLRGRHDEPVFGNNVRVESSHACRRMLRSDFVPQLRPKPYHQVDSSYGGSRLAQRGNCGNELAPVVLIQNIELQVSVRRCSERKY